MEKVIIKVTPTKNGYNAGCNLLKGWIVAYNGDFESFKIYVQESIKFYIDCAKKDGMGYPTIFNDEYKLIFDITDTTI